VSLEVAGNSRDDVADGHGLVRYIDRANVGVVCEDPDETDWISDSAGRCRSLLALAFGHRCRSCKLACHEDTRKRKCCLNLEYMLSSWPKLKMPCKSSYKICIAYLFYLILESDL